MLDYLPRWPKRREAGIGCVGAGFIMRDCHLPAYRKAGFRPVAVTSRSGEHAAALAQTFAIESVHGTLDELLANPQVEVLDIAVPPAVQPEIILRAARTANHLRGILAQKPLAMSYRQAKECVQACQAAGIVLAVNQNMRYDQSVRALKDLLGRGWLGEPMLATIEMRAIPHWMPWAEGLPSLATFIMSIHHLDTFRYWFGSPERVLASTRPDPRTKFAHYDGINLYILEYASGLRASSCDDVWAGPCREGAQPDIGIRWRVEGTEGMARGTIGWPSYPAPTPSTLDYTTSHEPGFWFQPRWPEVWFPDAFGGTMAQLLCALEEGTEPEISGRDNLETIALCEAVIRASRAHRGVGLDEIMSES
jgi:predicted dehydrogenase